MSLGSDRSGFSIWRDIVPVMVFALVLFITFSTRQYSDMQANLSPTHESIGHQRVTTYQRDRRRADSAMDDTTVVEALRSNS
jgi:hypothetical protein